MLKVALALLFAFVTLGAKEESKINKNTPHKVQISFGQIIENCDKGEQIGKFDSTFYFSDENDLLVWNVEKYWIRIRPTDYDREFNRKFVNNINWNNEILFNIYIKYNNKKIKIEHGELKQKNDSLYIEISPLGIRERLGGLGIALTQVNIEVIVDGKLKGKKELGVLTEWD